MGNRTSKLISIHSPRTGRDGLWISSAACTSPFQSTRPARGETTTRSAAISLSGHFNPLAPCGARLNGKSALSVPLLFQSTRPVRGETVVYRSLHRGSTNFNPLAPRGARRANGLYHYREEFISIHSPRVGRDPQGSAAQEEEFQSTRPAWGETLYAADVEHDPQISIHSPRVGRDFAAPSIKRWRSYFNPLAPRGARPLRPRTSAAVTVFQSTRPAWGETTLAASGATKSPYFNPLAPRGARLNIDCVRGVHTLISIHSPRVGRDVPDLD